MLVWDNRCLVHAATWYDADKEQRMMWRTTVRGNPGALYAGEKRSWIAEKPPPRPDQLLSSRWICVLRSR